MKLPVLSRLLPVLVLVALSTVPASSLENTLVLRATVVPVGTQGATVTFPTGWGREVLNPQLGKDQFRRSTADEYLILVESPGFLVDEESLMETIDPRVNELQSNGLSAAVVPLTPKPLENGLFVRKRVDLKLGSLELSYLVGTVGVPGYRFLVLGWSLRQQFGSLLADVDAILGTLKADPSAPQSRERLRVAQSVVTLDAAAVVVRYPAAFYRKGYSRNPVLLKLQGSDEDLIVSLVEYHGPWLQAAGDLPGELRLSRLTEVGLTPGATGKPLPAAYAEGRNPETANRLGVFWPLGDSGGLEVRVEGRRGFDTLSLVAQDFLRTLTVEVGSLQKALPEKASTPTVRPALGLVARAQRMGLVNDGLVDLFWDSQGEPWVLTEQGAGPLRRGRVDYQVHWDGVEPGVALGAQGALAVREGEIVEVGSSGSTSPELRADVLVAGRGRGGFVLARRPSSDADLAFPWGAGKTQNLVFVGDDGRTTDWGPLAAITQGAYDDGGTLVLVASDRDPVFAPGARVDLTWLREGRVVGRQVWDAVNSIHAAPGGWVVDGSPEGTPGVWLVRADGATTKILGSTGIRVLGWRDQSLWFAFRRNWEAPDSPWDQWSVFALPVSIPTPGLGAPSAREVNETGRRARLDAGYPRLTTRAEALALVTRVRASLWPQGGPTEPGAIDDLLETVLDDGQTLEAGGFRVLTLLLVGSLLDAGAEWVPAEEPSDAFQPSGFKESLFVRVAHAPALIYSALYEEEGWYRPASQMVDDLDGRRLLVGLSPGALQRRQGNLEDPDLPRLLASADAPTLGRWLDDPSRADNRRLRHGVLVALWNRADDRLAPVLARLGDREAGLERLFRLLVAWRTRGYQLEESDFLAVVGASPDEAIPGLKALVQGTHEPMATYFLARAWEFSSYSFGVYNARLCYQTLADDYQAGEALREWASSALTRLESEP